MKKIVAMLVAGLFTTGVFAQGAPAPAKKDAPKAEAKKDAPKAEAKKDAPKK